MKKPSLFDNPTLTLLIGCVFMFLGGVGFFIGLYWLYSGSRIEGGTCLTVTPIFIYGSIRRLKLVGEQIERADSRRWAAEQEGADRRRWASGCPLSAIRIVDPVFDPDFAQFLLSDDDDDYMVMVRRETRPQTHTHPAEDAAPPSDSEIRFVFKRLYLRTLGVDVKEAG